MLSATGAARPDRDPAAAPDRQATDGNSKMTETAFAGQAGYRHRPRRGKGHPAIAFAASLLLAACVGGTDGANTDPETGAAGAVNATRLVEQDVEAPDILQLHGAALWDGRPSLGGVWVASPDVRDPERVIMRNAANGKSVVGALFRREREHPGPKLQISSDAADALGMLAGAPAEITVTALKREQVPIALAPEEPADDAEEPAAAATGSIASDMVETRPLDAAPPDAAPPDDGPPPATAATTPAPPPQSAENAPPSTGQTLQVGFFSVEENASRAVAMLERAGVAASIRQGSANGKDYWSVTSRGDAATLTKIRAAGFADAYTLK